jgi:hypothetical protein
VPQPSQLCCWCELALLQWQHQQRHILQGKLQVGYTGGIAASCRQGSWEVVGSCAGEQATALLVTPISTCACAVVRRLASAVPGHSTFQAEYVGCYNMSAQ